MWGRLLCRSLALMMLASLCQIVGLAQEQPQERRWDELDAIIRGHDIRLALPDGVVIQGEVAGVGKDALVMNIKRTTNDVMHPRGRTSIPRSSVTLIELENLHPGRRRNLSAGLGAIAGVALGAVAARSTSSAGEAIITFAAVSSGGALIGYFVGRNFDSSRTPIKVVH